MRILVGLDGTAGERHVLDAAALLAEKLGGRLILVHAINLPTAVPPHALAVTPDEMGVMATGQAQAHLQKLAGELPAGIVERVQVEVGVPWRALCDLAKSEAVALMVIGSHDYSSIDRLLGTTAAKVVNHAHCSVLVQRTP